MQEAASHQAEVQPSRQPLQAQPENVLVAPPAAPPLGAKLSALPPGPNVTKLPLSHVLSQPQVKHHGSALQLALVKYNKKSCRALSAYMMTDRDSKSLGVHTLHHADSFEYLDKFLQTALMTSLGKSDCVDI